jgi:DNA-binding transcriptional LysR family regulator
MVAPIVRAGHPLTSLDGPICTERLATESWIVPSPPDLLRQKWEELFRVRAQRPPIAKIEYTALHAVRPLLSSTNLVAFLPVSLVRSEIDSGALSPLQTTDFAWRRTIGFVFLRRRSLSPAARVLLRHLRRAAADASAQ